ncbi:MAG: response regulator transcription factor, partial [Acidipropionibacterium jensenii]|nr:response regulator transcription factor [Acidipropionibacterium jensenii]
MAGPPRGPPTADSTPDTRHHRRTAGNRKEISAMSAQVLISVAVANDYPVIAHGLAEMLGRDHRFQVVESLSLATPSSPVDIVLFDAFARRDDDSELGALLRDPKCGKIVVYSGNLDPERVSLTFRMGVCGYLSKALDDRQLGDALVRIHQGERVMELEPTGSDTQYHAWPGQSYGLSAREAEMLALICQGATNEDIATSCYLTINSVKTYIRNAYRKIGVSRRSQAILWGVGHGMSPTTTS